MTPFIWTDTGEIPTYMFRYETIWVAFFTSKSDLNREFPLRCTLTLYMNANSVKHAQITAYTKKNVICFVKSIS